MGVDFYPCTNCGETFPDCGPYHICDQEHMLCAYCMRNVPEAKDTDADGWFNSKHCPTCAKGGSPRQRLEKAEGERDRFKKALEEIEAGAMEQTTEWCSDIARLALLSEKVTP